MAYFYFDSITSSSFDVIVSINTNYLFWRVFCRLADDTSDVTYDSEKMYTEEDFSITIDGLEPETEYIVNVGYSNVDYGGVTWLGGQRVTTKKAQPSINIEPWSWFDSNGYATASQTTAAYNVLMGNRTTDNFSHLVWNDFVDKVAEVVLATSAYGMDWSVGGGNYLPKEYCYVYQGDTLSADIYNSVKYNIGSLMSTGIQNVSRGDIITGYHIVHLADVLNELIYSI